MECAGDLDPAPQTDLDLLAGVFQLIVPLAEQMSRLSAFFMGTSYARSRFHAGVLIRIMPFIIFVTKKST